MTAFNPIANGPIAGSGGANYVINTTSGTFTLSMQGAGKLITDIYPSGQFSVSGTIVDLSAQRPLSVNSGTFTYSGQDVELDDGYGIVVDSGTYTLTGHTFILDTGFGIVWRKGEFVTTGHPVKKGISMSAESGTYILEGQNAPKGVLEKADTAYFNLTVQDATLTAQLHLRAETLEYAPYKGHDIKVRGFLGAYVPPEIWTEAA